MHFKKYYPTGYIDESDLPQDVTVKIASIGLEDLQLPGSAGKETKVVIAFDGAKKKFIVNKTNAIRIAKQYGNETESWVGKSITLYFDPTVKFGGAKVGGVRVREKTK